MVASVGGGKRSAPKLAYAEGGEELFVIDVEVHQEGLDFGRARWLGLTLEEARDADLIVFHVQDQGDVADFEARLLDGRANDGNEVLGGIAQRR